jgi:hypothetical protein
MKWRKRLGIEPSEDAFRRPSKWGHATGWLGGPAGGHATNRVRAGERPGHPKATGALA